VLAAALLIVASPLSAQDRAAQDKPALDDVVRQLETERARERQLATEAETQIREIERLRVQIAAAASSTQDSESALSAVEGRLAGLEAEEAAKTAELEHRRGELAALVGALQRLARHPPEALALLPVPPVDSVRTARLLGAVVPPIEAEAAAVGRELEQLKSLRASVAAERAALAEANRRLASDRDALRRLVERRGQLYRQTETARTESGQRIAALARQAEDLRDLLRRLEERRTAEAQAARQRTLEARVTEGLAGKLRRLGEARGQMVYPARGRIVRDFGQSDEGHQPHRGVSIETRGEAQVVAPFDGQIVFAGPFRGYGLILIIEHGEGYHTLLAGLGRIDVTPGQIVATGEPIATTGSSELPGPLVGNSPLSTGPVLYVELRRQGQPINPSPWLAASDGKVSG
jgi:septal ring factor EnvC (AmiA/AmiB activator)